MCPPYLWRMKKWTIKVPIHGQHFLVACVVAWQVWFSILRLVDLQHLTPRIDDLKYSKIGGTAKARVCKEKKKGFNSLVALSYDAQFSEKKKETSKCLGLWRGAPQSVPKVIQDIKESRIWCLAGAAGLKDIWPVGLTMGMSACRFLCLDGFLLVFSFLATTRWCLM